MDAAALQLAVELSRLTVAGIVLTGIVIGLLLGLLRLMTDLTRAP